MRLHTEPTAGEAAAAWCCLAAVLLVKTGWFLADADVRVFLGDSASYLHGALSGWVPGDRSFLYGWMIGLVAVPLQSLTALLVLQTVFGVASAMLLYGWLRRGVGVRPWVAGAAAVLLANEPAQVFYERMVMAEATGFLALVGLFVCCCVYVRTGRWRWIAAFVLCGVLAVSMRISVLPVVLVLGWLAPAVRFGLGGGADTSRRWLRAVLHTSVALVVTLTAHQAYKQWAGHVMNAEPNYTAQSGVFRLGLVLPLVRAEHLQASGVDPTLLVRVPGAHDPRTREWQLWSPDGFMAALDRDVTTPVDKLAGKISIRAVRDDPFGLVRMGVATVADYFDPQIAATRLGSDLGRMMPSETQQAQWRKAFGYDAAAVVPAETAATRWFSHGAPWLVLCLLVLAPLALVTLAFGWRAPGRDLRVMLCLMSLGLVAQHVLFSHIVSFRYLHPLPWFVLANLAVLADVRRARRAAGSLKQAPDASRPALLSADATRAVAGTPSTAS